MENYKITIKPLSPFNTPIQSDIIFGHIIWLWVYKKGDNFVKSILEDIKKGEKVFLISNGFRTNYVSFPFIPLNLKKDQELEVEFNKIFSKYSNNEKLNRGSEYFYTRLKKSLKKKIVSIRLDDLLFNIKNLDINNFIKDKYLIEDVIKDFLDNLIEEEKEKYEEKKEKFSTKNEIMRNTINRFTGSSLQQGGLFSTEVEFYNGSIDIYLKTNFLNKDEIFELFNEIGKNGYGGDSSIGRGQFEVKKIDIINFDEPKDYNYILNLSNYIPEDEEIDLENSYYDILVKYGKLGGKWAITQKENKKAFFKTPVIFIKDGSLIKVKNKKDLYGKMEEKVSLIEEVLQYGFSFNIKVNFVEEIK